MKQEREAQICWLIMLLIVLGPVMCAVFVKYWKFVFRLFGT